MGLVVNFRSNLEDRFWVALRDRNSRVTFGKKEWKPEDVGENKFDDKTLGCNYHFNLNPIEYNEFFEWLKEVQCIMDITFKFRYAYSKREAYTGHSDNGMYNHVWLEFN